MIAMLAIVVFEATLTFWFAIKYRFSQIAFLPFTSYASFSLLSFMAYGVAPKHLNQTADLPLLICFVMGFAAHLALAIIMLVKRWQLHQVLQFS